MTTEVNKELTDILQNIFKVEKYSDVFQLYSHSEKLNEQKIIPVVMIKMISKFLDHYIANNTYHLIIKTIRKNNDIESKFNLSKYQLTRILLEVIFNKTMTRELDYLFEQLKIYGNYVLDVSSSYDEIIDYIIECKKKTSKHIQESIDIMEKKLLKLKHEHSLFKSLILEESIRNLETKIVTNQARINNREKEVIENEIYSYCSFIIKRISIKNQDILKTKIIDYLKTLTSSDSVMKKLEDFEKVNQDNVYGKKFENIIYSKIKQVLHEHGYEVLFNSEFEFDFEYSGIKLEYDFIIGKIIDKTFVIKGVFDAKICKVLIKNDIHKLVKGVEYLMSNKLKLRGVFKKQYQDLFNDIIAIKNEKIITGYFCQAFYDDKKELSKTLSSYIVNNGYNLFSLINGDTILIDAFYTKIEESLNTDYYNLKQIFEKNDIIIYSLNDIINSDSEDDEIKNSEPFEKKHRLE